MSLYGQAFHRHHAKRPSEIVDFKDTDPNDMFSRVCRYLDQHPNVTLAQAFAAVRKGLTT